MSIGKEIISGIVNDTNSLYISAVLTESGIRNRYIVSIDDNEDDIIESFKYYLNKVDILITTGGLGPTFDDITIPSIAKAVDEPLVLSNHSYKHIKRFYENLYKEGKIKSSEMNTKRKKMAYIIKGSVELPNHTGAASGIYINKNFKHIFCLPGIPKEMNPMFKNNVLPIIRKISSGTTINRTYEFNINDETIIGQFIDKINDKDVYIKSLPEGFDSQTMEIRFTASGKNEKECLKKIESAKNRLLAQLNQYD